MAIQYDTIRVRIDYGNSRIIDEEIETSKDLRKIEKKMNMKLG